MVMEALRRARELEGGSEGGGGGGGSSLSVSLSVSISIALKREGGRSKEKIWLGVLSDEVPPPLLLPLVVCDDEVVHPDRASCWRRCCCQWLKAERS